LLDAFDRQRQVDLAARLVARHLTLGHSPQTLIATLACAVLREDAGFHAYQMMLEAGVRQFAVWGNTSEGRHILIAVARGVGFDVIPTDCMAATLKEALPDATHLVLAFDAGGSMSPGTARTMAQSMRLGQRGGRVPADFRAFADALAELTTYGQVVVLGSEQAIQGANARRPGFLHVAQVV